MEKKTMIYIGIGVAILVSAIGGYVVYKKTKLIKEQEDKIKQMELEDIAKFILAQVGSGKMTVLTAQKYEDKVLAEIRSLVAQNPANFNESQKLI